MEELSFLFKKVFNKDSRYHNLNEIKKILSIKGEEQEKTLHDTLNKLVETGVIFYEKNKGYKTFPTHAGIAFGNIEINKSGTGFVHTNDGYTILIENSDLNGALNGDSVIVSNIQNKRKDYYHGEVYKVVKRYTGNIILEVVKDGNRVSLVPYNNLESVNVNINKNELNNLIDGDIVLVKVGCDSSFDLYDATIDKIIGHKDDPDIDIKLIFEKYNIPVEFSDEIYEEAKKLPTIVKDSDLKNRVDLRNEIALTIDCDDTKDRDDSIIITKTNQGNYILKVNIAHVSHYIKNDSLIFKEALKRTTSHYPGNTCIPMLPHIISSGICSLNPNVDRLTRTVEMEIDNEGNIVNYSVYNSVINSKKAMSYSDVNRVLNGENVADYMEFKRELELLNDLNILLENKRNKRNYINFDTSEPRIIKDNYSDSYKLYPNKLGTAGQIIENCMLITNETVYKHFAWHLLAYRVHEKPNEEKVKEVINILKTSGIKIPKINNVDSASLKSIIDSLNNDDVSEIVREYLLRSMKKAKYGTVNVGHFALQYDIYGHFTSPIRRVIDLITHMTIDSIETFDYSEDSIKKFEKFLQEVCERTNRIEKISKIIEEEVIDMIMAKEMSKHVGEQYEVYVMDVSKHSMLVRTKNLVRGKVKLENMEDDTYYFDNDKKAIIGKKTKKKYQIGNKIVVLVKDACKETRTINFEIPKVYKRIS